MRYQVFIFFIFCIWGCPTHSLHGMGVLFTIPQLMSVLCHLQFSLLKTVLQWVSFCTCTNTWVACIPRRGISESKDVYNGKPHIFILWNFSRRVHLPTVSEGVWEYCLVVLWESSWPLSVYLSSRPRYSFEALSRGSRGVSASVLELLDLSWFLPFCS